MEIESEDYFGINSNFSNKPFNDVFSDINNNCKSENTIAGIDEVKKGVQYIPRSDNNIIPLDEDDFGKNEENSNLAQDLSKHNILYNSNKQEENEEQNKNEAEKLCLINAEEKGGSPIASSNLINISPTNIAISTNKDEKSLNCLSSNKDCVKAPKEITKEKIMPFIINYDLYDKELEGYKSLIFQKLVIFSKNKSIEEFEVLMKTKFRVILDKESIKFEGFLNQTLENYIKYIFNSFQNRAILLYQNLVDNEDKKAVKFKMRDIDILKRMIKDLSDIKENMEKEKLNGIEENKNTFDNFMNYNYQKDSTELLNENFQIMSANKKSKLNHTMIFNQENTNFETKKTEQKIKDKNINGKIKKRIVKVFKDEFNSKSKGFFFVTETAKENREDKKQKISTIEIENKNNIQQDLKFLDLKFLSIILENNEIDFSKESEEIAELLDMEINNYLLKIMADENKKREFIKLEKDERTQNILSNKCKEIIYEIIKKENLDGLLLLLAKNVIKINDHKYITFPNSTDLFAKLIKNLKGYEDLNLGLSENEINEINEIAKNYEEICQDFIGYLKKKTPRNVQNKNNN